MSLYQNVPGSETLHLVMYILKFQLFFYTKHVKYVKGMRCHKKVAVSIPLQTPSISEKTLSYSIDPNQEASPQCTAQQNRVTPLCSSYLEISYLPGFYFFCANCCAAMTTVLLMWYLVSLKLNWHSMHSAAIYSIGGPIKWLKNKPLFLFRSSKCKLASANNWASCWFK